MHNIRGVRCYDDLWNSQHAVCGVCGWVHVSPPLEEGLPVAQVCLQGLLHEPGLGLLGRLHLGLN